MQTSMPSVLGLQQALMKKMRKPGAKGAPTAKQFKKAAKTAKA